MSETHNPLRIQAHSRGRRITLVVNGKPCAAFEGEFLHAVLLAAGIRSLRGDAKTGEPRGIFCGMGICYECLVTINGVPDQRACMTPVHEGMRVETIKTGLS
jgi:D-hydroxyproline dehydrogenase subunit gamma